MKTLIRLFPLVALLTISNAFTQESLVASGCDSLCPPKPCCPPVCFEKGYPTDPSCTKTAYNEPASFTLAPASWDYWADVSFTCWIAEQQGMDLALSSVETSIGNVLTPSNGKYLFQETSFKPGFKLGLGADIDHDDWNFFAEYAWFRSTTLVNSAAPTDPRIGTPLATGGVSVWYMRNWANARATTVVSSWNLKMDLLDVGLSRPCYQGTHLIVSPFATLRGLWIRQLLDISLATNTAATGASRLAVSSATRSHSWAAGPAAGMQGKWHLGYGMRIEADVAGSVLFTRYTKVTHTETPFTVADANLNGEKSIFRFHDYDCLRATTEMNVGLGWGRYLDCRNYHWDILASYDLQVFWNQNMLRQLVDSANAGTGHGPSNLYLHGLTLATRLDF